MTKFVQAKLFVIFNRECSSGIQKVYFNNEQIKPLRSLAFLGPHSKIISNLTINNTWKPFHTEIILSTETALDMQKIYLEQENFHYLIFGRLPQDALENAFSSVRCRQPVPNAHAFRVSLRLICLSQFERPIKCSSYINDNSNHLVKYCKTNLTNHHIVENNMMTTDIDIDYIDVRHFRRYSASGLISFNWFHHL